MADGRTGKGYPKAQHSNSSPLNNTAGHQHGRGTGAGTRNWHGCGLPTRVVGVSARCPHRRALLTPARVISPSRCQQPPHDVNNPLTVPTTRVHAGGSTLARTERAADAIDVDTTGHAHCPGDARTRARPRRTAPDRAPPPRSTHTRTPIHETRTAHKGGIKPLCAAQCCVIPSLVCDTSGHGHRKRTERRSGPTNQRRTKPANRPTREERDG